MSAQPREGGAASSPGSRGDLFWPTERIPDAIREAVLRADLPIIAADVPAIGPTGNAHDLTRWLRHAAREMGLEGTPTDVNAAGLGDALEATGAYLVIGYPAGSSELGCIPVVRDRGGRCVVVRSDGSEWRVARHALSVAVQQATTAATSVSGLFEGLPGGEAALRRLVRQEGVGSSDLTVVRYEIDAAHPLMLQLKGAGLTRGVLGYVLVTTLQAAVAVVAAWTLGEAAVTGVIDLGRVVAWSVLAASDIPLQYVASTILGRLSLDVAGALKKRLLEGTLVIHDAEVRRQGFGALLARLNEASVVEQTSVAELVGVLAPLAQLAAALVLLTRGARAQVMVPLFLGFLAGAVGLAVRLGRRHRTWYAARLGLTEDLVDKIVGHRTRTLQESPAHLHDAEDAALYAYENLSARWDSVSCASTMYGRLWLLAAGVTILFSFVFGVGVGALFASAVATFLAYRGFSALLAAASRMAVWLSAWEGIQPLFIAGRTRARPGPTHVEPAGAVMDTVVSSVSFSYREGGRPVLSNANLRIKPGDRILVEGPSGGGKTTLSKLLTGELRASSGTILVDGIDFFSVSESMWRRRVASSPQFHENYLFSSTFGFNVDPKSLDGEMSVEAMGVCRELGLEDLLAKMPSGAAQVVGEAGWQLSHGERSRVFIARSLLQGAGLLIFDESFGALDPESLALAVECVRRRARTLVVIAHT